MKKREIDRKMDEIVAFAEIEKFIEHASEALLERDVRAAGVCVAAHLEPEILPGR